MPWMLEKFCHSNLIEKVCLETKLNPTCASIFKNRKEIQCLILFNPFLGLHKGGFLERLGFIRCCHNSCIFPCGHLCCLKNLVLTFHLKCFPLKKK